MDPREHDNMTLWDGKSQGFYEVYYLKFNLVPQNLAVWLRYTLLSPRKGLGLPVCELWGIFFDHRDSARNAAWKQTFPIQVFNREAGRFAIQIGDALLNQQGAKGRLGGVNGLDWDLEFEPDGPPFRHFPAESMYQGKLPKTKVVAPYLSMFVSGRITFRGTHYSLDRVPGHQAHIWGTQHANQWAWVNCNAWDGGARAVFEGLSARVGLGPITLPSLTMACLRWNGQEFWFNQPSRLLRNHAAYDVERLTMELLSPTARVTCVATTRIADLVGVRYEDPTGTERFCHNTKVGDLTVALSVRRGEAYEPTVTLTSTGAAAYEAVYLRPDPRVPVRI